MIERKFISEKVRDIRIKNYLSETLKRSAYSDARLQKTPLGMKVIIYTSKPGLVVGSGGQNIKKISETLQRRFKLENPQIEVSEVKVPELDAQIMSERISFQIERWGVQRFKKIGYSTSEMIMKAGARGVEILISGKVPGKRAKRWAFRDGYLPKAGSVATYEIANGFTEVLLRPGIIGIRVKIMHPDTNMPDEIRILDDESKKV